MKIKDLSLRQVIALAVIVGQLVPVLLTSWQTYEWQRNALMAGLANEHENLTSVLALGLQPALWNINDSDATQLLQAIANDDRVVSVSIADQRELLPGLKKIEHPERRHGQVLTLSKPMKWNGEFLGTVTVQMDAGHMEAALAANFRRFLNIVAAQLGLSLVLTMLVLNTRFVGPVKRLLKESAMLARRELDRPFIWDRHDEVGRLGASLESTRVALRTAFKEIEDSEQRFRKLSELSSDWYWERDEDDRLIMMSPGFKDMTGIDPMELIGSRRGERGDITYTPDSLKEANAHIARREPFRDLEWHVTRSDGQIRYGTASGEPVFDGDGHFRGYRGVGKDVTAWKAAIAAENSAARLRRLVELLPGAAIHIEGGVARMNAAAEMLTGYARDELADVAQWFAHMQTEGGASFQSRYDADKTARFPAPREIVFARKDGAERKVEFAAYSDEYSEVWLLHDVTQREEVKAALQQTLLEQQAILDNAIIGIYFLKERIVERCNRGFEELLGYGPGELTGKSTSIFFESMAAFDELGHVAHADIAAGRSWIGEWKLVRKDGSEILGLFHGKAVDPGDLSKGSVWAVKDITERRRTEETLRQTLAEQQALLDNSAVGIVFCKDRIVLRANAGFERLLGYESTELIGHSTRRWYDSEATYCAVGEALYATTSAGGVFSQDLQLVRKDGSRIWCNITSKIVGSDLTAVIDVIQDITQRKNAETALIETKNKLERGLKEIEQTRHEIVLLGELTSFLQSCPTADEACAAIAKYGPRLFPDGAGALYLIDDSGDVLDEKLRWGVPHSAARFFADQCWALRRGQPFNVDEPAESLCCPHLDSAGAAHPYACLPLMERGKIFGLLFLEYHEAAGNRHGEARRRLATALAEQTGLALANLRLRETLRQQSIRDPLTGLYNRRHMNEVLQRELARAERNKTPLAAAIIDVDYFKQFNDTFGHDAGDHVLQSVARVLEQKVRQTDIVCRFGGEEFVVLLPDASEQLALNRADDLLNGIRELKLKHGNRSLGNITASLGLALYPKHGRTVDSLIEAADIALYRAKERGRNRALLSEAEV